MPKSKILAAQDHGTIWHLFYETEDGDVGHVYFDHRPFADFYEGVTGQSFFADYASGRHRQYVSDQLKGRRISVEVELFNEVVVPEGDD